MYFWCFALMLKSTSLSVSSSPWRLPPSLCMHWYVLHDTTLFLSVCPLKRWVVKSTLYQDCQSSLLAEHPADFSHYQASHRLLSCRNKHEGRSNKNMSPDLVILHSLRYIIGVHFLNSKQIGQDFFVFQPDFFGVGSSLHFSHTYQNQMEIKRTANNILKQHMEVALGPNGKNLTKHSFYSAF